MATDVRTGAPDPEDAKRRFERVNSTLEQSGIQVADLPAAAGLIIRACCQRAPYLATLLARDPGRLGRVAASPYLRREKPTEVMAQELEVYLRVCPPDDNDRFRDCLRRYRADEMVRLGIRELGLGNPPEVGHELAHLADTTLNAAIAYHDAQLRRRYGPPRYVDDNGVEDDAALVVVGMGKLGGEELNFVSDIDVIYIYSSDNGSAGDLSLHEYYAKLCKAVTASIGEVTAEDVVFRVDLRLRPEGSQGPIANSLPSTERYYETWGRPWERQAWLKARPCAGSAALGAEVMEILRPFIYPRSTSPNIIDEVADLNRRIKSELDSQGVDGGFDLKNGVGGIREIEFFVQTLQLIHAGRQPGVRARATLTALDQLMFAGLISETEHRILTEAYRFLRRAEHVLQLESGRQTQRLPRDTQQLNTLAKRMNCADDAAFVQILREHTSGVERLFATLGVEEHGAPDRVVALLSGQLDAVQEQRILTDLGFSDAETAHRNLVAARRKPQSPLGLAASGAAARVAPGLVSEIATSPDPDQGLKFLSELISRRGSFSSIWGLVHDSPAIMRLVASLFGTSAYLAKTFINQPELVDVLVDIGSRHATRTADQLQAELSAHLGPVADDDHGEQWNRLAEFKHTQVLRIGLADIGGELDAERVSQELSSVAEVCLDRAYGFVQTAIEDRHGVARELDGTPVSLAILALGKLGASELGYASDLDVIFVYAADGDSDGGKPLDNVTYMTRVAQRLMSGLHAMHPGGRLYELDTRLRPAGAKGLLVSSLRSWQNYHRGEARMWERQSLIKLRPVAGDPTLGARVARAAADYVYGYAPGEAGRENPREIAVAITSMRDKIERELAGGRGAQDIKTGRGGLVDIEFASQYLQLVHGHAHPALRTGSTVSALGAAAELGLADASDCALLIDAYRFLRTLEHRMRIVHDRSVHRLPHDPAELDKLARRAGYPEGRALERDYLHWTGEVRRAYANVLYADIQRDRDTP